MVVLYFRLVPQCQFQQFLGKYNISDYKSVTLSVADYNTDAKQSSRILI